VASTRARDLLVAPVVADEELQGWLAPLNPVLYPAPLLRSKAGAAPGCPTFGNEAVLDRPEAALTALGVPPGLHRPQSGTHEVVWWDPRSLELDREVENWMRERDLLLVDEGAARVAAQGHEQWQKRRSDTVERGERPSLRVETATARASSTAAEAVEVAAVEVRTSSRPGGRP